MAKVKPLGDKVFIKPIEEETKTKSGLFLPESAKEKPKEAEVLAVGEGRYVDGKLVPLSVKVGDKILTKQWGGDEVKIDGVEYKIVEESDILAIIE